MNHYQEIKILPDPEFQTSMLMSALFSKLHRVLAQLKNSSIGISFPKAGIDNPTLGNLLRLHGTEKELNDLQEIDWLKGMRDHLAMKEIKTVPENAKHCHVQRVQTKSSVARLRRRYLKRHNKVTDQEVIKLIPDAVEKQLTLPYLQLKSESTEQRFRLFIKHQSAQETSVAGEFNSYGLSRQATVPWF